MYACLRHRHVWHWSSPECPPSEFWAEGRRERKCVCILFGDNSEIWECFMTPTKPPLFWSISKETKTKVVSFHFHKSIKDLNISFYQKQGIKEPLSRKDCVLFRVLNVLLPTILDEIEIDKKLSIDFDKQQHYRFKNWKLSTRYKGSLYAHFKIWSRVYLKDAYVDITKASLTHIDRIALNIKKKHEKVHFIALN